VGVIGNTLAEARTRRGVDLDEVHAATGIRPRYLRAIEEEDWNALPEEFYARSFVRKYAQFLGVDPDPLVDEYRRQRGTAGSAGAPTSPFARTNSRRADALRRRRKRQAVYVWVGTGLLAAAIVVAIVLIASGGGNESGGGKNAAAGGGANPGKGGKGKGGDLAGFVRRIAPRVKFAFLLGEMRGALAAACATHGVACALCPTLADAVERAAAAAAPGDHILLSPGFASFDMFRSYEDRGVQFERLVNNLGVTVAFR